MERDVDLELLMDLRLALVLIFYVVLGFLSWFTLEGKIRLATCIFLSGFALKTIIVALKKRMD